MNCPACNRLHLTRRELEPGLYAYACGNCEGAWLKLADYDTWRRSAAAQNTPAVALTAHPSEPPAGQVRRCPDCGTLLGRYRVGHGATFHVDRCAQCDGSWLDRDEWTQLRTLGVATQLISVFSPEWQKDVRRAEQFEAHERRFAARLGTEDLVRARDVRTWLVNHPRRSDILAYLELLPSRNQGGA